MANRTALYRTARGRIKKSLKELTQLNIARTIPIIFTTHSLPQRVVEKDPSYLEQLKATTDAVLEKCRTAKQSGCD